MLTLASDWLGLAVVLCVFAWLAGRRFVALSLPVAVALAALAVYLPTGSPRLTAPPQGRYTLIGADIEVDTAIYALLKDEAGVIRFYRLPYSADSANQLQAAKDAAEGEGGQGSVQAIVGQDGGVQYDGPPPVTGEQPKQAEQPAVQIP